MKFDLPSASSSRILRIKERILSSPRYASIEQARIITNSYKQHPSESKALKRAYALRAALNSLK
ncbi:hypothetical protein MASR1M31_15230 [Porphyromonadaceae bacterium]